MPYDANKIAEKTAEWNKHYRNIGREIKDLSDEAYEAEVGYGLLEVCDNDVDLALAVFSHDDNEGGWMCGDVVAFLEKKRQ